MSIVIIFNLEILDDISNNMDTVDLRVQRETQSVRAIGRKHGTCGE